MFSLITKTQNSDNRSSFLQICNFSQDYFSFVCQIFFAVFFLAVLIYFLSIHTSQAL